MNIFEIFLHFLFYSFLGWIAETIYCSVLQGKFVYRGFLNGPLCPIYGFGAMFVIYLLKPFANNIFILFIAGVIITSSLEYFSSFVLEKIFHMKWWDYSKNFLNLNGRICALNSSLFGILSVFAVRKLDPFTSNLVGKLSPNGAMFLSIGFFIYFIADFGVTTYTLLKIKGTLKKMELIITEAKDGMEEKLSGIKIDVFERRIFKSYPTLVSKKYPLGLSRVKNFLKEYKK